VSAGALFHPRSDAEGAAAGWPEQCNGALHEQASSLFVVCAFAGCAHVAPIETSKSSTVDPLVVRYQASRGVQRPTADVAETELFMVLARAGGERYRGLAQRSVATSFALIDRVWGGVFAPDGQTTASYGKTTADQAARLRLYALAWKEWKGSAFEAAALDVDRYVERFLTSPEGAFYSGQGGVDETTGPYFFSLDDAGRTSAGAPAIDTRISAQDNGAMIVALTELYNASGDATKLDRALKAGRHVTSMLKKDDGSYGTADDTLAMAGAAIALYRATHGSEWLREARTLVKYAMNNYGENLDLEPLATLASQARALATIDEDGDLGRFAESLVKHVDANQVSDSALVHLILSQDVRSLPRPALDVVAAQ